MRCWTRWRPNSRFRVVRDLETSLTVRAVDSIVLAVYAVRWHGQRDVRLDDVELSSPIPPGMVEAEVRVAGICGSDVSEYRAPLAIRAGRAHPLSGHVPPVTLGHEFSAVIREVGLGVTGVAPGDRVAADACWRCGACPACRSGHYNLCPGGGSIGFASDGAFAPRVRFPAYCIVPLPPAVNDVAGALLEPLAVGLHALDRGGAHKGDSVVILGFGPIGAAASLVARTLGMDVLVSEPSEGRRARATALGLATHEPTADPRETAREVRARTDGGADVVVDCSGAPGALQIAPEMTVRGGRVVLVGLPKQPPVVDGARLVLYERSIIGALAYTHDLPRVAEMIAVGALEPMGIVTRRIRLEDTADEIARLADDPRDDIKVLVEVAQ
jgi:(R,R)-butanediol dehydrogenase / meso-butanediol dehydrogenase / diacetyl reductase